MRKLQARIGPVKGQSTTHAAARPSAAASAASTAAASAATVYRQARDHLFILSANDRSINIEPKRGENIFVSAEITRQGYRERGLEETWSINET